MPEQRPYQVEGTARIKAAGRAVLGDEPGLGKTNQLLMAAEGKTLIIAPAMLEDNWCSIDPLDPGEIIRWRPDLLESDSIYWVGYSSLCGRGPDSKGRMTVPLTVPHPEYRQHWDTIILDESHYIKGRKTRWTKAIQTLESDQLFMATGTPIPNWAYEMFTTLQLLFPEEAQSGRKYGSYWRWVGEWFQVTQSRWDAQARDIGELWPMYTWNDFADSNGLEGRWVRRLRDDVLPDLPPLTEQTILLSMTPDQEKIYKQVKKELYAHVQETGHEIISWSKSGVHTKLMKLCTGVESEDLEYTKWGCKISAIRELMVGRTHPVVIFAAFRSTAAQIAKALTQDGLSAGVISGDYSMADRKDHAKTFRTGGYDVLVGTYGAMSEGLNFVQADTVIRAERDPRPSKNEQAIRRIHRIGQERPCLSIDLVTKGTVDVQMVKWLAEKSDHQMAALTAFDLLNAA